MDDSLETPDMILGQEFLTWLWHQTEMNPGSFKDGNGASCNVYMEQNIIVSAGNGQTREVAQVRGALSPLREARYGLGTGKKVVRALIRFEQNELVYQFTLKAEDFSLGSLKTPAIEKNDDEPDAWILEKFFLVETCLGILDNIYLNFLKLRLSSAWSKEVENIRQWISD